MNKFLLALILIVLFGTGGILTYRALNPEQAIAEKSVNNFMKLVQEDNLYDAFRATSALVRDRSFEGFESGLEEGGIVNWKSLNWTRVHVGSSEARFQGILVTNDDKEKEIIANLVREGGGWRIFSLSSDTDTSLFRETATTTVPVPGGAEKAVLPSEEEISNLVYATMLKFNESVQINYFGSFYQQVSLAWQKQTTPSQLDEVFKVFVEQHVNFGSIRKSELKYSVPPKLAANELLEVSGSYPQSGYSVGFELRYINENGRWLLFGINLNIIGKDKTEADKKDSVPAN